MLHLGLDLRVSHNRIVAMYFFASLTFLLAGLALSMFAQIQALEVTFPQIGYWIRTVYPYRDLGLRLYTIGLFLVAATFYQSLVGEGRASQKSKIAVAKF
jgi:hypothetical protein